jgi:hypothetical protein
MRLTASRDNSMPSRRPKSPVKIFKGAYRVAEFIESKAGDVDALEWVQITLSEGQLTHGCSCFGKITNIPRGYFECILSLGIVRFLCGLCGKLW